MLKNNSDLDLINTEPTSGYLFLVSPCISSNSLKFTISIVIANFISFSIFPTQTFFYIKTQTFFYIKATPDKIHVFKFFLSLLNPNSVMYT
jgi:hypothetical protein